MGKVIQCGKCKEDITEKPLVVILANGKQRSFHEDCVDIKSLDMHNKRDEHRVNPPKPL